MEYGAKGMQLDAVPKLSRRLNHENHSSCIRTYIPVAGVVLSPAWYRWGEVSVVMKHGNLGPEQAATPYTSEDIRYTTNKCKLYAYPIGWPREGHEVVLHSLAGVGTNVISVDLPGRQADASLKLTDAGLVVELPGTPPGRFAYGLRIQGLPPNIPDSEPAHPTHTSPGFTCTLMPRC